MIFSYSVCVLMWLMYLFGNNRKNDMRMLFNKLFIVGLLIVIILGGCISVICGVVNLILVFVL